MKATHQSIESQRDVTAWQFIYAAIPIPDWVTAYFYREEGDKYWHAAAKSGGEVHPKETDWAVTADGLTFTLTDSEFKSIFRKIP